MNFLFAWRYFKARKSTNAINIIAWISIVAIVFGTAALVLVLSVFNGFEGLVKSLYSSFYTDLRVSPSSGKVMRISQSQLDQMKGVAGIRNYALVLEEKALLQNGDYQTIIYLKGVDENYRYTSGVESHLVSGKYDLGTGEEPKIILGGGVENALGVYADQTIFPLNVYLPRKNNSLAIDLTEDISSDSIRPSASFIIQQDFDNKYGIINITFLRRALKLDPDQYSGVEIVVKPGTDVETVRKKLRTIFGEAYLVQNKYEQNRSLYSIMNVERWVIYAILSLILVVAAFNMVGALTMLVLEKKKDIGVLHALGASPGFIRNVFLSEGFLLALLGGGTGMLLAGLIGWLQMQFHLIPLQGGSFLIDYYPVKLRVMDFLLVGGTVFLIALIASWLPAAKAAREQFNLRSE